MAKSSKSAKHVLAWILMAMLVAGLGGFGIDGFLSQRATSIGSVGGRDITAQAYSRALQAEIRARERQTGQPLSFAQAQAMGIDSQVLGQLITQAALENEAARVGISVGDAQVQRAITGIQAFQGAGGAFDMNAYRYQLQNIGQTPAQFEAEVRRDLARGILQSATATGIETPENLRAPLLQYYAARHNFDVFTLTEANLPTPVAEPDAAAIQAYYEAHIADFTAPEIRHITYAWITPEMLADSVSVDEAAIRALYDQRHDQYVQPERRLVERLVYPDMAAAQAAKARLDAGTATFEQLVAERNLTLNDIDLGDVSQADLGPAGAAVFALQDPGSVAGPVMTNLGPALFRMNAILSAQTTTYEQARPELRAELATEAARQQISSQHEHFNDLLAGGATVEDLASETPMQLGQIDWSTDSSDGIAAYAEFAAAAAAITADDFPTLTALSDGGLFAMRLDSITPPTPRPLDSVRDAVVAGARTQAVDAALLAEGQRLSPELAAQGSDAFAAAHGLTPQHYDAVTRLDRLADLPPSMLDSIFAADAGTPVLNVADGTALLALVKDTQPPDMQDAQTQRLVSAIDQQVGSALAQDVFTYFARALQAEAGITLNQAAIQAVNSGFN